jgi:hypothetical protein
MRLSSIIFVLLLSPVSLTAQTSTGNNPAVLVAPPASHACPVQLRVDRTPQGAVVVTKGAPAPRGQGLNITFARPESQIVSADVVVHGYPAIVHIIPATPSAPTEVTETFHLTGSAGQPLLRSSVWTKQVIFVSWIEVTRLDYAGGTTWQPSAPRQCSAAPSLYVLVDSAAR